MKKQYNEIMDKIEVTDEMRKRILTNLQDFDFESTIQPKVTRFPAIKKYLSIAACFIILLITSLTLPKLLDGGEPKNPIVTNPGSDIVKFSSIAELEAAVNFDIPEITSLPFSPDSQIYTAYGSEMAQIIYKKEEQTAIFRISTGQKDNSGDYNHYSEIKKISVGTITATLKGNSNSFTLAVWSDATFSYSLSLSDGLSLTDWQSLITQIGNNGNSNS